MATEQASPTATTRTCDSCGLSVAQPHGTRRTLCPGCGKFYDKQTAHLVRLSHDNVYKGTDNIRERLEEIRRQKEALTAKDVRMDPEKLPKPGGKLQSIANFFHNLGPKKSKPSDSQRSESTELPPISPNSRGLPSSVVSPPPRFSETDIKSPYLAKPLSSNELRNMFKEAKDGTADWSSFASSYSATFQSVAAINATFKIDPTQDYNTAEDSGVNMDLLTTVYEILVKAPEDVHKATLKSIVGCLVNEKKIGDQTSPRLRSKDELRCYLILSQNPLFQYSSSYVIFAHLMRRIATLSKSDLQFFLQWLKKLGPSQFGSLIQRLNSFMSCRLRPSKPDELPPMSKCLWWIPSCTKVLAVLNAANNACSPPIVPRQAFYNEILNDLDLFADYCTWQMGSSEEGGELDGAGFTFCQYPFLLTMPAKRFIMQKDSEQQMILQARKSLVEKVQLHQMPDMGSLFLEITVKRNNLVFDSLKEIMQKKTELKKKLKITFEGEPGLDLGGLTKEWFMLLVKQIFSPKFRTFAYNNKAGTYWLAFAKEEKKLNEFNLAGALMGLAVYNSINLDINFPPCLFKKLLHPAVAPFNSPKTLVGVDTSATLDDMAHIMPEVASSLKELLEYDEDVEKDMCMTFQVSITQFGTTYTESLKKGGENIPVTNANRKEFVNLYVDWIINRAIYVQFRAFYFGFHSVCASNALLLLQPDEVEVLVCGSSELNMADLRKVTVYDGYRVIDQVIQDFWDILLGLPMELQKKFLLFVTGSDRLPVGGMAEMKFKISRLNEPDSLPVAHTCFNHLILPTYKSKKTLRQKLLLAIQNTEGFGLE